MSAAVAEHPGVIERTFRGDSPTIECEVGGFIADVDAAFAQTGATGMLVRRRRDGELTTVTVILTFGEPPAGEVPSPPPPPRRVPRVTSRQPAPASSQVLVAGLAPPRRCFG